jgi:uncharacterized protein
MQLPAAIHPFILKLAARCNLDCSYCYVYNQADTGWRSRPKLMSQTVFDATVARIRRHCRASGQRSALVLFHGGEPTLIGPARFAHYCMQLRQALHGEVEVVPAIQTNGVLLDDAWADVLAEHDVQVGVSLDGPAAVNDSARLDHHGRGSHAAVLRGLESLRRRGLDFTLLCVIRLGSDPVVVHRHLLAQGPKEISYLLPAESREAVAALRARFGPTPCADFLIPIFDAWWFEGDIDQPIREFWNMARVIMGGQSRLDSIGNPPLCFVAVETDGAMEGLDKLRICEDGLTATGLNVLDADFSDIAAHSPFHRAAMAGPPLPTDCASCPEALTCAGGYLPHRYMESAGFDHSSAWCADLLKLFSHVRLRMAIGPAETLQRRRALRAERAPVPA